MKGAIAELWVSTIKPPKMTIIMRMGINQYFFRSRRNDQNSLIRLSPWDSGTSTGDRPYSRPRRFRAS